MILTHTSLPHNVTSTIYVCGSFTFTTQIDCGDQNISYTKPPVLLILRQIDNFLIYVLSYFTRLPYGYSTPPSLNHSLYNIYDRISGAIHYFLYFSLSHVYE